MGSNLRAFSGKNILLRTNLLVCLTIIVGFVLTAVLSYQTSYNASLASIEQVSALTSEGIYHQMAMTFTKPVNISLTMANDTLLKSYLEEEKARLEEDAYIAAISRYLNAYQKQYGYDSVFLVSSATGRYYNFNGFDRVLTRGNPENVWYFSLLDADETYRIVVDNDEVEGAGNAITVFVNCKIMDDAGACMGIVGVGLSINYFQNLLESYETEFGVQIYLVNHDGVIEISSSHTGYEDAVDLFALKGYGENVRERVLGWREDGEAYKQWTSSAQSGKNGQYVVSRYLPELDWHLVVNRDTSAMVEQLNRQLVQTFVIIFVIIAIILFIITYVIRSFNSRIVALTRSIEQERKTLFEKATEQLFENIYELDITHNRPANRATEMYFESIGAPPGTPFDKTLSMIAEKQIKEEFRQGYLDAFSPQNVERAFAAGRDSLHYEFMTAGEDGGYYWMRITARLIKWAGDGALHMLVYRQNIDAEKRQEQRMRELAQTDEMTGFLTKTATSQRVHAQLWNEPEQMYAFFIFDIDNFKTANDQHGHAFGDAVIKAFTDVIRGHFRQEDIMGRIGGDEFAVFVPAPSLEWVGETARVLSRSLARTFEKDGSVWHISASIGVSIAPRDGTDYDTLYQKADEALYETKKRGKNGVTIYRGL